MCLAVGLGRPGPREEISFEAPLQNPAQTADDLHNQGQCFYDHLGRHYRTEWLGGVTVRTSDLRSRGRGFDSGGSGRYQVVTTWMGDCMLTRKPSSYITNHQSTQPSIPPG